MGRQRLLLDNMNLLPLDIFLLEQGQHKVILMNSFNICPAEKKGLLMDTFMSSEQYFLALGVDEKYSDE